MSTTTTSSSENSKPYGILTNQLISLLGFDDGATDVLDHLLTIESRANLLDYLTQLLGNDKMELLIHFVDSVNKYHSGEQLTVFNGNDKNNTTNEVDNRTEKYIDDHIESIKTKTPINESRKVSSSIKPNVHKGSQQSNVKTLNINSKISTTNNKNKTALTNLKQLQGKQSGPQKIATKSNAEKTATTITAAQSTKVDVVPATETKTTSPSYSVMASTGMRTQPICGCFGTIHTKLVANCLHCGRICCEKEGINDYCPFCTHLVHPVPTSTNELLILGTNSTTKPAALNDEEKILQAWNQKERLLQYDREFAQRTIIIDDQEDYYHYNSDPNQNIWLTEEEKIIAKEREQQHSDAISKRNYIQLKLDL